MKKILSFLLCVLMLMTMSVGVTAAKFTDTAGMDCETAVDVLSALGIVEGKTAGKYDPSAALTRAEMATIIMRTLNAPMTSGEAVFTDVSSSHWAYAAIGAAYQVGIVNGVGETTFAPDATLTYEQAVKMVVGALGYGIKAEAAGGYPAGYLSTAAQLGIISGVSAESPIKRGDMAKLIYNALDVDLFQKVSYGADNFSYEATKGETLLSTYLKVNVYKTMVTAAPLTVLTPPAASLNADEAALENGLVVKKGKTDIQNMVGMRVTVYTRTEKGEDMPTALAAVVHPGTKVTTVSASDIDATTSASRFAFTGTDGKDKEIALSGASAIYNGKPMPLNTIKLVPDAGTVTVIENTDSIAVLVEEYKTHIVKYVDAERYTVSFMEADAETGALEAELDPEGDYALSMTDADGKTVDFTALQKWTVLSIAYDTYPNPTAVRVKVSTKTASGEVTEMSEKTAKIDNKSYPVSKYMKTSSLTPLALGTDAKYCLDFTGSIVAVNTEEATKYTYAWLVAANRKNSLESEAQLKLFTDKGEMKTFAVTYNVLLDGESVTPDMLLPEGGNAIYDGESAKPQLLRYEENIAKRLLVSLDTAENLTSQAGDVTDEMRRENAFSFDYYYNDGTDPATGVKNVTAKMTKYNGTPVGEGPAKHSGNPYYNGGGYGIGTFLSRLQITTNTKIFSIPKAGSRDEEYTLIESPTLNYEYSQLLGCLGFFDWQEDYKVGAMVVFKGLNGTSESSDEYQGPDQGTEMGLFIGASRRMNLFDEEEFVLRILTASGKEVTYTAKEDDEVLYKAANADVDRDPAWYSKDADGNIIPNEEAKDRGKYWQDKNGYSLPDRPSMYMAIEDLTPGDVLEFKASDTELTYISMAHRSKYSGNVEFINNLASDSNKMILGASPDYFYNSGGRLFSVATVTDVTDTGIIGETRLADSQGFFKGNTATHVYPIAAGRFIIWDTRTQTGRFAKGTEVKRGDMIFSAWFKTSQDLVVIYR